MTGTDFALEGVSMRFDALTVLEDVSLRIDAGERVALVGPSGSGKTTLLRLLGGVLEPTGGGVRIGGAALAGMSPAALRAVRSQIGFVHQDHALIPNVRVAHNVATGRVGRRGLFGVMRDVLWPSRDTLAEMHALLDRVGIEEKLFERTDRLSGGQRQRVAIARALFQQPSAILADEPVSSVDPSRARDTVELLQSISRDDGITLCASLHNVELAREFFPRVLGLRDGCIAFDVPSGELSEDAVAELYELSSNEMLADGA